ncbi:hypothetical protein PAMP_000263 [Pampus punctatissimus]
MERRKAISTTGGGEEKAVEDVKEWMCLGVTGCRDNKREGREDEGSSYRLCNINLWCRDKKGQPLSYTHRLIDQQPGAESIPRERQQREREAAYLVSPSISQGKDAQASLMTDLFPAGLNCTSCLSSRETSVSARPKQRQPATVYTCPAGPWSWSQQTQDELSTTLSHSEKSLFTYNRIHEDSLPEYLLFGCVCVGERKRVGARLYTCMTENEKVMKEGVLE